MGLGYLIYVSVESRPMQSTDLDDILEICTANNKDKDISGMLLYIEGRFFQVLEGESHVIQDLYAAIVRDPRHKNATLIAQGNLDRRIFDGWTMRFNSISETEFSRISGISKFRNLFNLKPKDPQNPAWMFVRRFTDKTFPSKSWWKA